VFLPMYSFQLCRLRLPCVPDMPHPAVPGPPCPCCSWPMAAYAPCCSGQTCGRMLWACHASQMMRSRPPQVRCAASPGAAGWHGSGALQSQQLAATQLAAMAACCYGSLLLWQLISGHAAEAAAGLHHPPVAALTLALCALPVCLLLFALSLCRCGAAGAEPGVAAQTRPVR
jgi:hypothetical protein